MKARPEDRGPPCFRSSKSRPLPPSPERTPKTLALAVPKTSALDGYVRLHADSRRNAVMAGRRSAVVVPCPPLPAAPPAAPPPPTPNPASPPHSEPITAPPAPCYDQPALGGEVQVLEGEAEGAPPPGLASIPESDWTPEPSPPPPASTDSHGSLSDFSRPPSSLFSRSTDLASGRSSVLSAAGIGDSDPEGGGRSSPMTSPLASYPPTASNHRQSPANATPPPYEQLFGRTEALSPLKSDKPVSRSESARIESRHLDASLDPGLHPSLASDHGLVTLAFPSATWSSCPSPQRSSPRSSGSRPKRTPSATRLESRRWSVLPPISPDRGLCGSAASRYSELSCCQSHVFDELEAIAPRSISCPSLDRLSDSSDCPSPDTELSPGLAALTVGCDSGNLGSLSRVQLLLLDRPQPENLPSLFGPQEELSPMQDWSDLRMQYGPGGGLRPLTAGSGSERCDSAGKVQEKESDQSEGGSGSPSSWIIDPSPSLSMLRSPCVSHHGSSRAEEEEEANYLGWGDRVESSAEGRRPGSVDDRTEEEDRRKTKALNLLSKLQDDTPRPANGSKGCSDFEDFDFLAKFCIFSQEKLAEYKRAFEAEDSDGDGYLSSLQALLALKGVVPPELLSDEEEIYVYRILEMVDFRVTDGLVDLRLFAVIASLAQKIAAMDDFMRSLITDMDLRSLEVRLFKAKQLFLFLLEEQRGDDGGQRGFISAEQLLLELKAGGIHLEQEAAVRLELQRIPPLDLLDFLAYLPLFMLIHKSVIANPLDDSSRL